MRIQVGDGTPIGSPSLDQTVTGGGINHARNRRPSIVAGEVEVSTNRCGDHLGKPASLVNLRATRRLTRDPLSPCKSAGIDSQSRSTHRPTVLNFDNRNGRNVGSWAPKPAEYSRIVSRIWFKAARCRYRAYSKDSRLPRKLQPGDVTRTDGRPSHRVAHGQLHAVRAPGDSAQMKIDRNGSREQSPSHCRNHRPSSDVRKGRHGTNSNPNPAIADDTVLQQLRQV